MLSKAKAGLAAVMAGGLLTLGAGMGTAHATPTGEAFTQQARAAHLTQAQTKSLRSEVDRYLKATGGRQVALNEIDLGGKGKVLVAIPGEAHPRDFASGAGMRPAYDPCLQGSLYNGYFCAYSQADYQGSEQQMYYCQSYAMNFGRGGSWINNQTQGRQARMYGKYGDLLYTTPGAYSSDSNGDWYYVWSVRPC
ncbi:hypothetical protein AV521_31815 [Streptomyces sp. IMTB 2501]|uniref:peptidase inhibitor family I36 protein n=1 Tax=Streptomyces sp. IMTB 2501 TaxID=1776340 RepID=UPI00096C3A0D|nr:peptidase inhibitor family I36 protein [Streptomyces sp. IMTB 2501]OLZ65616.1 hypothetical protein AV521_31815 [Streptomyces sp. IMTB 2501]